MKRKTIFSLLGLLLLFFLGVLLYFFSSLVTLLLCSVVVAYLLCPLINLFTASRVPVAAAVLVTYGMILMILIFVGSVILPGLFAEFSSLLSVLPVYYQYILDLWQQFVAHSVLPEFIVSIGADKKIMTMLMTWTDGFAQSTVDLLTLLPQAAVYSFLVPVIAYYFLRDKEKIVGGMLMIFPPGVRSIVLGLGEEIQGVLWSFIRGNMVISLIVGGCTALGLFILGVDYAAVLGLLYGLFDIIPYFGPFLGAIPVILLPLLQGDVNIFFVLLLLFGVQQGENIFISPRVLGTSVGLHPVTVIFLVLIGGSLGGILGMILIIPLAAVSKVILKYIYEKAVSCC